MDRRVGIEKRIVLQHASQIFSFENVEKTSKMFLNPYPRGKAPPILIWRLPLRTTLVHTLKNSALMKYIQNKVLVSLFWVHICEPEDPQKFGIIPLNDGNELIQFTIYVGAQKIDQIFNVEYQSHNRLVTPSIFFA